MKCNSQLIQFRNDYEMIVSSYITRLIIKVASKNTGGVDCDTGCETNLFGIATVCFSIQILAAALT